MVLARQKQWTQKIYRHSSKFQNPLHQNYKHVKTLESSLLGCSGEQLHSVIVFIGEEVLSKQRCHQT
ncbi:nuclease-related domain-containing protein [Photobacterium kishitanii]|uniref:nuclease-related domain-containing protein n=1 Tax=Photobacterium kishitanii TaxID=318456 RepID=UPI00273A3C22|nr:nuclease-related domain-containing protein [Photobacterium kishitanii]